MIRAITFTLAEQGDDDVLVLVSSIPGIVKVDRISRHSRNDLGRRICYANVSEEADLDKVCRAVSAVDGVQSASVPPLRFAM